MDPHGTTQKERVNNVRNKIYHKITESLQGWDSQNLERFQSLINAIIHFLCLTWLVLCISVCIDSYFCVCVYFDLHYELCNIAPFNMRWIKMKLNYQTIEICSMSDKTELFTLMGYKTDEEWEFWLIFFLPLDTMRWPYTCRKVVTHNTLNGPNSNMLLSVSETFDKRCSQLAI